MFAGEVTEGGEEGFGAGGGEAWGYDGGDEGGCGVEGADVGDYVRGVGEAGGGGGVAVVVWTGVFAVHADLADECSLAFLEADVGEEVGGCGVDGCVVGGGGGAVG